MSLPRIAELLETHLHKWASAKGLPIATDNVSFDTPDGPYLRSHVMPATNDVIDLAGKLVVYSGVYQVNICTPVGRGKSTAFSLAEDLVNHFAVNTVLTDGEFSCYIDEIPSASSGITNDRVYTVPVSMGYRSDTIKN